MSEQKLVPEVTDKLKLLSAKYNIPIEQVTKEYWEFFNDPFVQTDPQFQGDADRHNYCIKVIWVRYASAPPSQEYAIIPIGYSEPRMTKQNLLIARILALIKEKDGFEKRTIICRGDKSNVIKDIQLFFGYQVALNYFNNTYFTVNKTVFENPKLSPIDAFTLLRKQVGVKEVKIAETPFSISRKDEQNKFVDEWDLYMVRGIVVRFAKGIRDDGTQWGLYVLSDDSVAGSQPSLTPDGRIIPNQFAVWTPASQVRFDENSEIAAVGTIGLTDQKEPQMNAVAVLPIHARLIEV